MWPEIKKAVPQARLDIYYGWQLFDKFYHNNPGSMNWKKKMVEMMKHKGIKEHGRIPQRKLDLEYKKSGLFTYPTHFGEISCISAMKAQAYGAIPVVIDYAALKETVQHGIKVLGDIYDPETQKDYQEKLIWALKNHKWQEDVRKKMMSWAKKKFPWSSVAKQWSEEFGR
jgi:glycosyltransferase involved in cell wall biosynthesis